MKQKIVDFEKTPEYQQLKKLFARTSFFSAIYKARNENTHSNFIAWLLEDERALRLFLQALCFVPIPLNQLKDNRFIINNYTLSNVKIEREKYVDEAGHIDIYIEMKIDGAPYVLIIENKVYSKEQNNQTQNYSDWLNKNTSEDTIKIMVYLTPMPENSYTQLSEVECSCKQFTQINYQLLADRVIRSYSKICDDNVKRYIAEYITCLSTPENGEKIMIYNDEDKKLFKAFWDKHSDLLMPTLRAVVDTNDELNDEEKNAIKLVTNMGRKWNWRYKNEAVFRNLSMSKLVFDLISDYVERNNVVDIKILEEKFPKSIQSQNGKLRTVKKVNDFMGDDIKRYYPVYIKVGGEDVAVSNQWTGGVTFSRFREHVKTLGYIIEEAN